MRYTQAERNLPALALETIKQTVEPEWVPLECSEHGCVAAVECHDCERCTKHCTHRRRGVALGFGAFLSELDALRANNKARHPRKRKG